MKKLMFIVFAFLISNSYAQGSANAMSNLRGPTSATALNSFKSRFDAVTSGQWITTSIENTVKGSPLALKENKELVIYTKDKKVYKIENGNYNSKVDKLVTEYKKDSIYIFEDNNIDYAKLDNKVLKKFKNIKTEKRRYHFVLSQGEKLTLVKGYSSRIKEGTINVMTKQKETSDKYIVNDQYFISKDNSTVEELKLKKKSILNLMSDSKKDIISFVDKNNLSYKKEEDLIKIFKYYNTL